MFACITLISALGLCTLYLDLLSYVVNFVILFSKLFRRLVALKHTVQKINIIKMIAININIAKR